MTSGKLLRKIGLASAGATVALGVASTGIAGAAPAREASRDTTVVTAEFDCTSVDVSSSRHDLSNVVLLFDDGSVQRFEGLSGRTGTFAGTGTYAGLELDGVWVKAGNNKSGDGPGYGEFVDAPDGTCGSPEPAASNSSTPPPAPAPSPAPSSPSPNSGSRGDDAVVGAVLDCEGSVTVTSTKDLSNVVLVLSDGREVKFDGLSGHEKTFEAPAGLTIVAVYVKSGANHSGDGPGYGEKVIPAAADDCDTTTDTVVKPVVDTDTVVKPVVDTPVVDTPAAPAVEAAVVGTSVAGERAAAPAVEGAQVLGVTLERSPATAPAPAPAALAFTGLDVSSLLLASGGLMTSGAVLVRRSRRRS